MESCLEGSPGCRRPAAPGCAPSPKPPHSLFPASSGGRGSHKVIPGQSHGVFSQKNWRQVGPQIPNANKRTLSKERGHVWAVGEAAPWSSLPSKRPFLRDYPSPPLPGLQVLPQAEQGCWVAPLPAPSRCVLHASPPCSWAVDTHVALEGCPLLSLRTCPPFSAHSPIGQRRLSQGKPGFFFCPRVKPM